MVRIGKIQDSMAKQDHIFLILSSENTRCRVIIGLSDYSVSYPLPELGLCGPEFFAVPANNARCILLLLLLLLRTQGSPLSVEKAIDYVVNGQGDELPDFD
jgi:hypothetical protein